MKKLILLLIICISVGNVVRAQSDANPALDLSMAPSNITPSGSSIMEVMVSNYGNSTDIVANSLIVQVSVGSNAEMIGIASGSNTNWTLISSTTGASNTYKFQNTSGILYTFETDSILVTVRAVALGGPSNITGNVGYKTGPNPLLSGSAPSSTQGNTITSDDNAVTSLTVSTTLAVSLSDMRADAAECAAKIAWTSLREEAGSSFDVEYSPDGVRFVKVGNVAGRSATGSSYSYTYSQGNGRGFYRLKMSCTLGETLYSSVVTASSKCREKKAFIYPNPIQNQENLHIVVSNFVGIIKGDLINAAGQVAVTKALINGSNTIMIANLPEGIYTFKVTDEAKEIQNFKIVIVK